MSTSRRALPVLAALRPVQLAWFDATTTRRIALEVLREALGKDRTRTVVRGIARRAFFADPSKGLARPRTRDERLTRMQLRSVLLLDASLREDLGLADDAARSVVRDVMRASGTAFLLRFFGGFGAEEWDHASDGERAAFARDLSSRIFNAEVTDVATTPTSLSFEVTRCRFAADLHALGRSDLAPLFCEVDAALVERDDVPMGLERPTTIAAGHDRCRFRFVRVDDPR